LLKEREKEIEGQKEQTSQTHGGHPVMISSGVDAVLQIAPGIIIIITTN